MIINISKYSAESIFNVQKSNSLVGMPYWANLNFNLKPNVKGKFGGLGIYGILFDQKLIYIGKFLGQKKNNLGGDIRQARWSKHMGSLTLRARNISFSKRSITSISKQVNLEPKSSLLKTNNELLSRDRGCLSTFNRFMFGASHWESFQNIDNSIMERFDFVYVKLQDIDTISNIRKLMGEAEDELVKKLKPSCNAVINSNIANHDLTEDDFNEVAQEVLESKCLITSVESTDLAQEVETFNKQNEFESDDIESVSYKFFERLESAPAWAQNIVSSLIDHYEKNTQIEIHFKQPKTPQLRIRDLGEYEDSPSQNILTLIWQPGLQCFRILALADVNECSMYELTELKDTYNGEPLNSQFRFTEESRFSELIEIIEKSVAKRR